MAKSKNPNKWYGWRADRPDGRDRGLTLPRLSHFPQQTANKKFCPAVMDQKAIGSCTAHGGTGVARFDLIKEGKPDVQLSRLQLYYNTRRIEGTIGSDSGAEIRNMIKALKNWGAAPETDWPYVVRKFRTKPPKIADVHGLAYQALVYERIDKGNMSVGDKENAIRTVLASGYPIVFGYTCYTSFESPAVEEHGMMPMPVLVGPNREEDCGGHCVYAYDYGLKGDNTVTCRNSWGTDWGDNGDFHMPMEFLCNGDLANDLWVVRKVG